MDTLTPGVCAARSDVGGPCVPFVPDFTVTGCATGLDCVAGHCAMPPASGACGPNGDCAPGSFCSASSLTCTPQVPAGAPCTDSSQCAGGATCVNAVCTVLDCAEPAP